MSPITSRITPSVQRIGIPTMNPMMRRMIPRVIMRYLANGRLIQNQLWHIYASICWMVSPSHALRRSARVQTGCHDGGARLVQPSVDGRGNAEHEDQGVAAESRVAWPAWTEEFLDG